MSQFTTNRLQASSFTTVQTPAGSSPTAGSPNDVLTLTSLDGSILITGNALTDTIDFSVTPAGAGYAFGVFQLPSGTLISASSPGDTMYLTSNDNFVNITGNPLTKTTDVSAGPYAIALALIFG